MCTQRSQKSVCVDENALNHSPSAFARTHTHLYLVVVVVVVVVVVMTFVFYKGTEVSKAKMIGIREVFFHSLGFFTNGISIIFFS